MAVREDIIHRHYALCTLLAIENLDITHIVHRCKGTFVVLQLEVAQLYRKRESVLDTIHCNKVLHLIALAQMHSALHSPLPGGVGTKENQSKRCMEHKGRKALMHLAAHQIEQTTKGQQQPQGNHRTCAIDILAHKVATAELFDNGSHHQHNDNKRSRAKGEIFQ